MAQLVFKNVSFRKGNGQARKTILEDLSLTVDPGELVTILGCSGAGKSTLLRLAIGLEEASEGQIYFEGSSIDAWKITEMRRRMGMVFQLPCLFPETVRENLLYGPGLHHALPDNEQAFVQDLLKQVGLPHDLGERRTNELSVGQQTRVSLARTLANRPSVLLIDEPTASLDPQSATHIIRLIQRLNQNAGLTVLCVIHQVETAIILGGRSLLIHEGRLIEDGLVDELFGQEKSPAVQRFLSGVDK